jgi:hypothetical protein
MTAEQHIGTLQRVSGHTFDTVYDIVFTTKRVMALIVEHPGDLPQRLGMVEMLIGGGFGRPGERLRRKQIAEERRRLYRERNLDELVLLDRLNFEIPCDRIASVDIKRRLFRTSLTFRLTAAGRTIRFRLKRAQADEARDLAGRIGPHVISSL